ncbi:hypothetical protein R1sor_018862 [Riccia sorocarpa]|uniref:Major facilitator superfamily (MFS) profile domain-containing protein n=1 Tax=Riccia sorocarpa TaxID=122646 RepID=A0ABD3IEI2_9MARC
MATIGGYRIHARLRLRETQIVDLGSRLCPCGVDLRASSTDSRKLGTFSAALPKSVSVPGKELSPGLVEKRRFLRRRVRLDEQSETSEDTPKFGQATEQATTGVFGWDLSWLPVLPHVITAAMANFLFGYHIGIINGPLESIAKELNFEGNTLLEGFVVSIFIVGAFVGSISGGVLSDSVGRRRTFQICAVPLIAGAALSASAQSVDAVILGRLLVGVGIGVNTALVPLYISEVAPTKYRGALGSLCQIGTCTGLIAALIFGIPAETDPHWWRTMFWVATLPGLLLIGGMQYAVESPRWLGKVGKWDEARATIDRLWGKDQVEEAIEELRNANATKEEEASWSELLSRRYFKVAGIGGALFALQQFAGINGVLYFSSSSFQDAGITNSIAASAAVGFSNLAGAVVASSLMDRQGRRKLLMGSYTGMAISVGIMVAALNLPMDEQLSHTLSVVGNLTYVFTFALGAGPVTALIIPEMCSTRIRAKALAVSLCVHWVCNFAIGLLFLELVQRFGLSAVYTSFGVVSLLSVLFTNLYIIETKGRSLEEIEKILLGSEGAN